MLSLQITLYLIQFAEILFMCRRCKPVITFLISLVYFGVITVMAIDRKTVTPRPVGYFIAFMIALHYTLLMTISMYMVVYIFMYNRYANLLNKIGLWVIPISIVVTLLGYINGIIIRTSLYVVNTDKIDNDVRIVHLSDLHLSNICGAEEIRNIVTKVNMLNPDIVCITGDTFTRTLSTQIDMNLVYDEFRKLNPKYGTYIIQGNHDRSLMEHLEKLSDESGFTLLTDEVATVDEINIVGRLCYPYGAPLSTFNIDGRNFNIVLDHIPNRYKESADNNSDILLCGHTHGGQILPVRLVYDLIYKFGFGANYYKNTFVVVSQGTYLIYPYCRMIGKSEIVCIDLKSSK